MYRNAHVVELIEQAQRATPYCPACGEHTEVVALEGTIVLRCSTIGLPRTGLARLLNDIVGREHIARPIVDTGLASAA